MKIHLYDTDNNCYTYTAEESFIVEPNAMWILNDFGDDRLTIITHADDGIQRQVVVGKLQKSEKR